MKQAWICLALLFAGFLAACGGGGSAETTNVTLQSQTLGFSNPVPAPIIVGQILVNPASGSGSGAISYSSSNTAVATVDSSGTVTAIGAGSATIAATIESDTTYASASASYSITVTDPVSLTFTTVGPLSLIIGDITTNTAVSPSAGAITYSSSDPAIADVDTGGQVTAYATGSVTITADQAAYGVYPADSDSYQIDVVAASFTFTTWIGASDTHVNVSADTDGIELYRSSAADCDLNDYTLCDDGQLTILNGSSITDTAANSSRAGFYTFKHGAHQVSSDVSHQEFSGRKNTAVTVFKGKLFVSGGSQSTLECNNDVWSSADGARWSLLTDNAAFPRRYGHRMTVFHGRLWIVGGNIPGISAGCGQPSNDVWYSEDGVNWTQATANTGFAPRHNHQLVVFNNKLWVIGGFDYTSVTYFNDVWSSSDGINWTQETANADFSGRYAHFVEVFNNRLYLAGGLTIGGASPELWSSADGQNWTLENADIGVNRVFALVVVDNQLWIADEAEQLWYSANGTNWTLKPLTQKFLQPRVAYSIVGFNNALWLLAGSSLGVTYYTDVWYTTPSATEWMRAAPGANYPMRYGHAGLSFNNKIWLIGGYDNYDYYADIWTSTDGITWTEEVATTDFSGRYQHKVIEFNGRLWLFGGIDSSGRKYDLWSSDDGLSWTQETAHSVLTSRYAFQLAVFNNRLWLFGGRSSADDSHLDEVWSSSDGLNWSQELSATFPERADTNMFVYDNKLWLVGGSDSSSLLSLNDVWSSTDGIDWVQVNASAPFNNRLDTQYFVHNNRLWIVGGDFGNKVKFDDVWSTTDGIIWTEENASAAFSPRSQHPVVEFNGQFWMLGGYKWTDTFYKDIWTSTDGIIWRTPQRRTMSFP